MESVIEEIIKSPRDVLDLIKYLNQKELSLILSYFSESYHNSESLIIDEVYDQIIQVYELKYGEYEVIGAEPRGSKGEKTKLPFFLSSLRKIKTEKELSNWMKDFSGPYLVEDKIDGLTLLLHKNKLYTRGKGVLGKDVTHLMGFLKIPKTNLSVRGEVVLTKENFLKIGKGFKDPRSLVAGTVNSKQSFNPEIAKHLSFFAYRIMDSKEKPSRQLLKLQKEGFQIPYVRVLEQEDLTYPNLHDYLVQRKEFADYEMDGLVVYQDEFTEFPKDENPKHVVAFKIEGEKIITKVLSVEWEASKDGRLIPDVRFERINVEGRDHDYVTGNNARFIMTNKIGPGAVIAIVINIVAKIDNVLKPGEYLELPEREYMWDENEVHFILTDKFDDEVMVNKIDYFLNTLGVKGVGPERIKLLVEHGINNIDELIRVNEKDLVKIPTIGATTAKILDFEVKQSLKNTTYPILAVATGIFPGVGLKRFNLLFEVIPDLLVLFQNDPLSIADFIRNIKGFDKMSDDIVGKLPKFVEWLSKNENFIKIKEEEKIIKPQNLKEKTFVFSGFIFDRELDREIVERGGKVVGAISKKTSMLIMKDVKDKKGKAEKAEKLGIPLIMKEEFIKKYIL